MHYGSGLVTPGNGEGKEPEVGKDTVSRAEGRLRCVIGFREVGEQFWKNVSRVQYPRDISGSS